MPFFEYQARDASGKLSKGLMDVSTQDELIHILHDMGYMVTAVKNAGAKAVTKGAFNKSLHIKTEEILMFYIQLSSMLGVGFPIVSSLRTINDQLGNKAFKKLVTDLTKNIEAGDALSAALARYPSVFSELFVNMVRAGEVSGKLSEVLKKFADFSEKQAEIRQKIQGAVFYPIILLAAGFLVSLFLVTFVIPQFAEIFVKSGIKLPLPTLILYNTGLLIKRYWYISLVLCVFIFIAVKIALKTEKVKFVFDRIKLNLPVIGQLYRRVAIARFTRTFATLVESGVPILQSLDIVRDVIDNMVLARVISQVRVTVEKGGEIAESLKTSLEFPPDVVQMVSVGENSGNLETMLTKISDVYEMYVDYSIKKLIILIEPIFLVFLGGLVGFIMASMLLPIFDLVKILRH